jgi:hypothetical protein
LRLDGFVALEADDQPGQLTTKPFVLDGEQLELNVAAPDGAVRVELLDLAGKPISGYAGSQAKEFTGVDDLRWRPSWEGHADLADLVGQTVRLRIHLRDAQLFAFQVTAN